MSHQPSWGELAASARTSEQRSLSWRFHNLPYSDNIHDDFIALVEDAINFSIRHMVRNKNTISSSDGKPMLDEDQLTLLLSGPILGVGLDIWHDANVGGHCDITITGMDSMLWLGEAKIYTGYTKLMGGFQQLSDRYATGLPGENSGGMLIYFFGQRVDCMMSNWRDYLRSTRDDLLDEDVVGYPYHCRTFEKHRATGETLNVRHFAVPLLHSPTDSKKAPARKAPTRKTTAPTASREAKA